MPITRPRSSTAALPPHDEIEGESTSARSSMYSQKAEKRRTAWSVLVACTRSPSSSSPTVPVIAPTAVSPEGTSVAAAHGPSPLRRTTARPVSRSRPTRRADTFRPSCTRASIRNASSTT